MPNTEYKITALVVPPVAPSQIPLRPNSMMAYAAQWPVGVAQDAVCSSSRRIVWRWDVSGSPLYHVPASGSQTAGGGTQEHPDRDAFRTVGSIEVPTLTPGCFLRARILYAPGGNTSVDAGGGTWDPGGPFGLVRLTHTWTGSGGTDGPYNYDVVLPSSTLTDAEEPDDFGEGWAALGVEDLPLLAPSGYETTAVSYEYTEGHSCSLRLQFRGAPRVLSVVVYEQPVRSVYLHDEDFPGAVNGQSAYEVRQTYVPQVSAANGPDFAENRFGTWRMLTTAERQTELGPVVADLVSWNESTADFTFTTPAPIVVSSTSFVDIFDGATSYNRNRPGYIVACAHAQQHHLCDANLVLGGAAAVVPVRVVVAANITGAANLGVVRIQSGTYEWIDVEVDGLITGEYEATGYLESQVAPDHAWATLQFFAQVDSDDIEISSISIHFDS